MKLNGTGEKIHNLVRLHNLKLRDAINEFKATRPDINFVTIDIHGFFNDLIAQPQKI